MCFWVTVPGPGVLVGMQREGSNHDLSRLRSVAQTPDLRAALFSARSPCELLERIVPGDPLHIGELVAQELADAAYALDAQRVHRRALARIAHAAFSHGPPIASLLAPFASKAHATDAEAFEGWCRAHVREALEDVRRAPSCADGQVVGRTGSRLGPADAFDALATPLGLDRIALRDACRRFNALEQGQRRAFLRAVVERRPLEDLIGRDGCSLTELARVVREALESFRGVWQARTRRQTLVPVPSRRSR